MKYIIENNSGWDKAFKVFGGTYVVKNGKTETVEVEGGLTDEKIEEHKSKGVTIKPADGKTETEHDREDLKKQADELGLEYAKNITDKKLAAMIDEALAS